MARSWLITCRGVAKKIRNDNCSNRQISELGAEACRECPNCKYIIDNSDVAVQWPGLPAGVKFDPSDLELLEHLEQKIGVGGSEPHMFLDEFIPTVENDEGICYSHPENLSGTKKDGRSAHFFHTVSNAYGCGQRKRRRISNSDYSTSDEHVRWHKTGKSKAIYDNGVIKGWKKILVLYKSSQTGGKPDKADWVMHQYHLGLEEKEKVGEFVVCKIFYQLKTNQVDKYEPEMANEASDAFTARDYPKTPMAKIPQPCRPNNSPCETEQTLSKEYETEQKQNYPNLQYQEEETDRPAISLADADPSDWFLASQAGTSLEEPLRCHEDINSFGPDRPIYSQGYYDGLPDLLNLGPPPEQDLLFSSQDLLSFFSQEDVQG